MDSNKQINPLQSLFSDIKKIIDATVFKDKKAASDGETSQSKAAANVWLNAKLGYDTYATYTKWWTVSMFKSIDKSLTDEIIKYYMNNPYHIPIKYQEDLQELGRQTYIDQYEEINPYYRALIGLPPISDTDYIYLSDELKSKFGIAKDIPVHELSTYLQNRYIYTSEYQTQLTNNPDKEYLKYLGNNKVDLFAARNANDFEIIKYPTDRTDINPNLLNKFASLYDDYREYVMATLYNTQFEDLYVGYRDFMGFLIKVYTMLQLGNVALESINTKNYLDDSILYMIMSMYGIPDDILLTNEARRNLVSNILKLIREKGTSDVYYDLINILGYEDVTISKLLLMKGTEIDPDTNELNHYFLKIDLKDELPYETIVSGNATEYKYHDIVDKDPAWYANDPEVQKILSEREYSESESKYIMIDGLIHQMESMFETIYFNRLVLDNGENISNYMISIPELNLNDQMVSIYDIILYLICMSCKLNGINKNTSEYFVWSPFKDNAKDPFMDKVKDRSLLNIAGFNFDLNMDILNSYLNTCEYVETGRLKQFLDNINIDSPSDITRIYDTVLVPLREWLEKKVANAENHKEFIEYENLYKAIFTYDIRKANKLIIPEDIKSLYKDDNYYRVELENSDISNESIYIYLYDLMNFDILTMRSSVNMFYFLTFATGEPEINEDMINQLKSYIETSDNLTNIDPTYKEYLLFKIDFEVNNFIGKYYDNYYGLLKIRNEELFNLLSEIDTSKEKALNTINTIITTLEKSLNMHLRYYEQSILGNELYFKPLKELIKYFKSSEVDIIKTSTKYIFDDKMDIGGNSNMFKLFDELDHIVHKITVANSKYASEFGLYDTEHKTTHKIKMNDRKVKYETIIGYGFAAERHEFMQGSFHMMDKCLFKKNNIPIDDDAKWIDSEYSDDRYLYPSSNSKIDFEGWKDFVESYNG